MGETETKEDSVPQGSSFRRRVLLAATGILIYVGLHATFDSSTVNRTLEQSQSPCTTPVVMSISPDDFDFWITTQFLPYLGLYHGEQLTFQNFGVIFQVTPLEDETLCEGVPDIYYNTENRHLSLTIEFLHKYDNGPRQIGLLFAKKWAISLSPGATHQISKLFDKLKPRTGDIEALRIIVEEHLSSNTYTMKLMLIKQHGNGWISVHPEYLTCPDGGTRPFLLKSIGKNTNLSSQRAAQLSHVRSWKVLGVDIWAQSDVVEPEVQFDPTEFMPPLNNVRLGNPFQTSSTLQKAFSKDNSPYSSQFEGSEEPEHEFCTTP